MKKNKLIYNSDDICIIGASGQFPMAGDITEFWDNIANGRDCITRHPEKNTAPDPASPEMQGSSQK